MQFVPYKSLGEIQLGMHQRDIRYRLASAYEHFMKAGITPADNFADMGIIVYYDTRKRCEGIEAYTPATVEYGGVELLGVRYSSVRQWLVGQDTATEENKDGVISEKLGLSLYVPGLCQDKDAQIEGFMAFREGYYDVDTNRLTRTILDNLAAGQSNEHGVWERFKRSVSKILRFR
jgi:hypothetical protein